MLVAFLLVAITTVFGAVAYSAHVPGGTALLEFLVALVVGAASFAALGLATTAIIPNADASPAIVNAIVLPLLFLSGVFFAIGDDAPAWIKVVGAIFPVKHFTDAMQSAYLGTLSGPRGGAVVPFDWTDVLVVAAWGLGGLIVASALLQLGTAQVIHASAKVVASARSWGSRAERPGPRRVWMRKFLAGAAVVAIVAAACSKTPTPAASSGPPTSAPASVDACATDNLNLKIPGKLTIGTDNPVFPPWYVGGGDYGPWKPDPSIGSGPPARGTSPRSPMRSPTDWGSRRTRWTG